MISENSIDVSKFSGGPLGGFTLPPDTGRPKGGTGPSLSDFRNGPLEGLVLPQAKSESNLKEKTALDFFREFDLSERTPVIGTIEELQDAAELVDIAFRAQRGRASEEELASISHYAEEARRPQSFAYQVLNLVSEVPKILVEMALSGGVATLGKAAVSKGAGSAAKRFALGKLTKDLSERALKKGASKLNARVAQVAGATAAGSYAIGGRVAADEIIGNLTSRVIGAETRGGRVSLSTYQKILQGVEFGEDEHGSLELLLNQDIASFSEKLPAGILEQFIEVGSELSGAALAKVPVLAKVKALQVKVLEDWLKLNPKSGITGFAKVLEKGGFHGALSEVLEERIGDTGRAIAGLALPEDFGGFEDIFPGWEQLAVELVSFSIPGPALSAASKGVTVVQSQIASRSATGAEAPLSAESRQIQSPDAPAPAPVADIPRDALSQQERVEPQESVEPVTVGFVQAEQVEGDVEAFRQAVGDPSVRVAEVPEGEEGNDLRALGEVAESFGANLVLVEADNPLSVEGLSRTPGQIVVDKNSFDPARVFWHELPHNIRRENAEAFDALATDIERLDPEGFAAARVEASGRSQEEIAEETVARRVEAVGAYLSALTSEGGEAFIQKALEIESDKGILRRIFDALRSGIARITGGQANTRIAQLDAISEELGVEFDPTNARIAKRVHEALVQGANIALGRASNLRRRESRAERELVAREEREQAQAEDDLREAPADSDEPGGNEAPAGDIRAEDVIQDEGFEAEDDGTRFSVDRKKPRVRRTAAPKSFKFAQVQPLGREGQGSDLTPANFAALRAEGKSVTEILYKSLDGVRRQVQDKALPLRRFEEQIKGKGGLVRDSAYNLVTSVEGMKAHGHHVLQRDYLEKIEKLLKSSDLEAKDSVESLDDYAVARYHHERKSLIRIKKDAARARIERNHSEQLAANEQLKERLDGMTEQREALQEELRLELFPEGRDKTEVEAELKALSRSRARIREKHRREQKSRTKVREKLKRELNKFPPDSAWNPDQNQITGLTDAEAQGIIDAADPKVVEAHEVLVDMNNWTRELLVERGHVTRSWANWMRVNQPNYVPLRDTEATTDFNHFSRHGGFETPGPEFDPAFGRNTRAANSFFFSAVQSMDAITRTSNGEVGRAFLQLLEDNPGLREWKEVDPPVDSEGFRTEAGDKTFEVKRDGESIWIAIQDERLAGVLKGIESEPLGKILGFSGTVTRFLAQLSTSKNPAFVLPNIIRDTIQAAIAVAERSDVSASDIAKKWTSATRSIGRAMRGDVAETEMDRYAVEFLEGGASTGFSMQQDYEAISRQVTKRIGRGSLASALGPGGSVWQAVDSFNSMTENATRLSVYASMRSKGTSQSEAIAYARDITVNFARKGEWGTKMNALYMFSNVGIQGSHRIIQAFARSPKVRRRLAAVVTASFLADAINRAWAGEDEDGRNAYDAIPRHERERNLILFLPGGSEAWVKIPLPYGFNLFSVIGQGIGALTSGARGPGEVAGDLISAAHGSFNPVGSDITVSPLQFISPTILDPLVQSAENKNWLGYSIVPGGGSFDNRPDNQRHGRNVSPIADAITTALSDWTGGDETIGGAVDISPETLEHWYEFATGGAGKFVERLVKTGSSLIRDGKAPINDVPILRRFITTADGRTSKSYYYDNREAVETASRRIRAHEREGRKVRARELRKEFGWLLRLEDSLKATKKKLRDLNKERLGADRKRAIELEDQEIEIMQAWNREYSKLTKALGGR